MGKVSAADPVTFADANLKAIVEKTLGSSDPTPDDISAVAGLMNNLNPSLRLI